MRSALENYFQHRRLLLAPMEGVTNDIFRDEICCLGNVDIVATEFVRITGPKQKVRPFIRHGQVPLQIQLMANSPEMLRDCILFLKSRGVLSDSDWIDLNVGCPSRRVNAHGAGAALLLEPEKLSKLLISMRSVHPGPLSMKTRVGFHDDKKYHDLLGVLSDAPIDFLTMHARTRCAGYTDPINLDYLTEAVERLPYPVIGNGDVWSAEDAVRMFDKTSVQGVMCGRGVMMNPYLFVDIAAALAGEESEEADPDRRRRLFHFADNLLARYAETEPRPRAYVGRTKEFLVWFSRNEHVGRDLFSRAKRLSTIDEIRAELQRYSEEFSLSNAA